MKRIRILAALLMALAWAAGAGAQTMTVYLDSIDNGGGATTNPSNFAVYLPVSGFTYSNFHYGSSIPSGWRLNAPTLIDTGAGMVFAFGSFQDGAQMPTVMPASIGSLYPAQSPTLQAPPLTGVPTILAVFDYEGTISTPASAPGSWAVYGSNGNKQNKMLFVGFGPTRLDLSTLALPSQPPVAVAGSAQGAVVGDLVTLTGSASSDPEGQLAASLWVQDGGPAVTLSSPSGLSTTFQAPVEAAGTTLHFRLTVTDASGLSDTATTTVVVAAAANQPPAADAGANQTVDESSHVSLNAAASVDPDGSIVTYAWTQTGGPTVSLSDASSPSPTFNAPAVDPSGAALTFQLTVTDDKGLTATATTIVNVSNVNLAPLAGAGKNQTVAQGDSVQLSGSASMDPDGSIATYLWSQTGGAPVTLSNPATANASFTAPVVSSATTLTFLLTVTDDGGLVDTEVVSVTVNPPASPAPAPASDGGSGGGCFVSTVGSPNLSAIGLLLLAALAGLGFATARKD